MALTYIPLRTDRWKTYGEIRCKRPIILKPWMDNSVLDFALIGTSSIDRLL